MLAWMVASAFGVSVPAEKIYTDPKKNSNSRIDYKSDFYFSIFLVVVIGCHRHLKIF